MTNEQYLKNLEVPQGKIDVILDTDAYNESDDQYAIAYMLKHSEKLNCVGITAAPFFNAKSSSPEDGMEKSYNEIHHILSLMNYECADGFVLRGSTKYLDDEKTPVISDAAKFIADKANEYSPERPLYIVAIGAITNVASAILLNPNMKENCVVIWLGGQALHVGTTDEFNLIQDVPAGRVIMGCGVPFVQLPCAGVVSAFTTCKYEIEHWLIGKNELATYLGNHSIEDAEFYMQDKTLPWSKVVWDVTAVAWLLNDGDRFMRSRVIPAVIPSYDGTYGKEVRAHQMRYVYQIHRDPLFRDLVKKLTE